MDFINLHAHTKYSDGSGSMEENVLMSRQLGFSACVTTDHIYQGLNHYSQTPLTFTEQLIVADNLSKQYNYPVICGAEVGVGRMEEVVIFGLGAIFEVFDIIEHRMVTLEDMIRIKSKHECVVNLCHPMKPQEFADAGFAQILDGFEYIHSAVNEFDNPRWHRDVPKEFESLVRLCNSDAHNVGSLETCWNETEFPITSEKELIRYIKDRRSFKHIIPERWRS